MKRIALPLKKYSHYLTYLCVLCCLFFAPNQLNAQVGINNIDPKASLDITATDPTDPQSTEGLLVPRVSVFPTIDPGTDQNGMLLYLTATVGLNTPGFYYWNQTSTSWLKVTDSSVNSSDADFYEEGTTTAPNAITDNIFHTGDISIRAEDFESDTTTYPDYVFENYFEGSSKINPAYNFKTLFEVENFIKDNGHLPGVKSFSEVKKDGMKINLAETSVKNLEKIEELFLYTIEISKENKQLKSENESLQEKQKSLEERLQKLENIINNNN